MKLPDNSSYLRDGAQSLSLHKAHRVHAPHRIRPDLEALEERVVPANSTMAPVAATASANPNQALPVGDNLGTFWSKQSASPSSTATSTGAKASDATLPNLSKPAANVVQAVQLDAEQVGLPQIAVSQQQPFGFEEAQGTPGVGQTAGAVIFRITRTGGPGNSQPLTFFYKVDGPAVAGLDYVAPAGVATIPAGQDYVDVAILPLPRIPQPIPAVTLQFELQPSESYTIDIFGQNRLGVISELNDPLPPPNPGGGGGPIVGPSGGGTIGNSGGQTVPPVVVPPVVTVPINPPSQTGFNSGVEIAAFGLNVATAAQGYSYAGFAFTPRDGRLGDGANGSERDDGLDSILHRSGAGATGEISGQLFEDINGNGVFDFGKPRLPGVAVYLDLNNNGIFDPGEPSTVTNSKGEYVFTGLTQGKYYVRQAVPGRSLQTMPADNAPQSVQLETVISTVKDRNFGVQIKTGPTRRPPTLTPTIPAPSANPKPGGNEESEPSLPTDDASEE